MLSNFGFCCFSSLIWKSLNYVRLSNPFNPFQPVCTVQAVLISFKSCLVGFKWFLYFFFRVTIGEVLMQFSCFAEPWNSTYMNFSTLFWKRCSISILQWVIGPQSWMYFLFFLMVMIVVDGNYLVINHM